MRHTDGCLDANPATKLNQDHRQIILLAIARDGNKTTFTLVDRLVVARKTRFPTLRKKARRVGAPDHLWQGKKYSPLLVTQHTRAYQR